MLSAFLLLEFFGLLFSSVLADTNDQVYGNCNPGTFADPAARLRPRFRYWLPDAGVDKSIVAADIASAGSIGAGGVEFLPFYGYGNGTLPKPAGADWGTYGFGTPAFQEMFRTALQAHADNGLVMDFPLGPNQGQGVPAEIDNEGLQWDLIPAIASIPTNGVLNGTIPGWGSGQLVGFISALALSESVIQTTTPSFTGPIPSNYSRIVLAHDTFHDSTDQVSTSGNVALSFPAMTNGSEYKLFAFYQKRTLSKSLPVSTNTTHTIFDNGSYTVDHYSATGAQTTTKFWEEYILTDGVKELLMQVGNYGWEDSIEISTNISWTPKLPQRFQEKFGYSIIQYLPLIMYGNNNINLQGAGSYLAVLDTEDAGAKYINDYRSVLADGYQEYLTELTNWTNTYLNLQMSAQVSYNLPMDAEASIPFVNAPESESLQFEDKIDSYRQYSGPANLAGKRVVSIELGAIAMKAFIYTLPNLLRQFNLAVCGGVNQAVLHGQTYSGEYYATTWPGYNSFSWLISENYNNKHPYWDNGFAEVLEYMGRVQHVQQTGVPKVDVVFYNKASATAPYWDVQYQLDDLSNAGWTYSYLSPENFKLQRATVQNGVLAPDGPAYKAMVITSNSNMTLSGINYIQSYADAGLPVIISGGNPSPYPSADSQADILAALSKLKTSKNVYSVGNSEVASKLTSLGLFPNVALQTNGTCHTTWRQDDHNRVGYAFIMCEDGYSTGAIRVPTKATPFVLDAWTGEERPILNYSVDNSGFTTIPIGLASNQTMIVAFGLTSENGTGIPSFHATALPSGALGYKLTDAKEMAIQVASSSSSADQDNNVVLSTGVQYAANQNTTASSAFPLSNWSLTVEHWEAPANLLNVSIQAVKHNTTHHLDSLTSWLNIPALANTSGVGYYSTSFSWPPVQGSADGAYIKFSPILNAIRLYINGKRVPPFDPNAPQTDIGTYLQTGQNDVLAIVPSTMGNYLNTILSETRNGDGSITIFGLLGIQITPTDQGLVGDVTIIPYQETRIKG